MSQSPRGVTDPDTSRRPARGGMQVKVYLVMERLNLVPQGAANLVVRAVKLTRDAAQDIVDRTPGTFVEKHVAVK